MELALKVAFNIPTDLSEIKLSDYQRFMGIAKEKHDDVFLRQKLVQIFCNVPLLAVNGMKRKDFKNISNSLLTTLQQKPDLKRTFDLKGREFGFIPLLDSISIGEYIDLDKYILDSENLHKAMAVLFRPVTYQKKGKYRIEDYGGSDKYSELLKEMPMDVVKGAMVFFWALGTQLLKITPKFLERKLMANPKAAAALGRNGDGISTFTNSLGESCSELERLLRFQLVRL